MVTTDDGFTLPVPLAAKAVQCAEKLLKWMEELDNKPKAILFAVTLVNLLKKCCSSMEGKSVQVKREKMWEKYHQLRSSEKFCALWSAFINESIHEEACPIFYQFVADTLFEEVVINHFPINNNKPIEEVTSYFSYEELNALRYTAGYVIKAVLEKVEKSKKDEALKQELILCLSNLKERGEKEGKHLWVHIYRITSYRYIIAESHSSPHQSTDWVNCIDRGGLQHVDDVTFSLFAAIELEFRKYRDISDDDTIKKAMDGILGNDDVQVYWEYLSMEWEEEIASSLLKLLTEHWITIRGHSQASAFLEHYKQSVKTGVQKAKGIRKKLF